MASENQEAQEAAAKKTQKQEEGEGTSSMPPQEKEPRAIQTSPNPLEVLLYDHAVEHYHLLRLPAGDRTHAMNNKPIRLQDGLHIGSVHGGWLILYRTFTRPSVIVSGYEDQFLSYNLVYLLNPISGVKLGLPPESCFLTRKDYRHQFIADVITSNCSPDSPEFIVVAFFVNSNRHWLAFCRIGDGSWTPIADIKHIHDASLLIQLALALDDKNKLVYSLNRNPSASNYDMMVFDFKDPKNIKMKRLVMAESDSLPRKGVFTPAVKAVLKGDGRMLTNFKIGDRKVFLVADCSCGDLFLVLQMNDVQGFANLLPVNGFRVFIKLGEGGLQWKEIHDLGDHRSIFISHFNSRVISTAELNAGSKSEEELFRGNCIYFALQNSFETKTRMRRDIGVFCLADRSIMHFELPWEFHKVAMATLWWFHPHST